MGKMKGWKRETESGKGGEQSKGEGEGRHILFRGKQLGAKRILTQATNLLA